MAPAQMSPKVKQLSIIAHSYVDKPQRFRDDFPSKGGRVVMLIIYFKFTPS
jgi:hypothetical protein